MQQATDTLYDVSDEEPFGSLIERTSLAIGRLDARVSDSFLTPAWQLRASWIGYARGLQLHGIEIDEIDVFCWGCGITLPGRPRFQTVVDPFAAFAPWRERLAAKGHHWAEDLPFSIMSGSGHRRQPMLLRAIELQVEYLKASRSLEAWLSLPTLLHRLGVCETPLPCLVAGDRRLLLSTRDSNPAVRRVLRGLEAAALAGRKSLEAVEDAHAASVAALRNELRPTALRQLASLMMRAPVQSPESVGRQLKMTLSGAGKLLARAAALGMVRETSGRRAWRTYVTSDLALSLGFAPPPKGRPPARTTRLEPDRDLAAMLAAFDRDMAAFVVRFPNAGPGTKKDRPEGRPEILGEDA